MRRTEGGRVCNACEVSCSINVGKAVEVMPCRATFSSIQSDRHHRCCWASHTDVWTNDLLHVSHCREPTRACVAQAMEEHQRGLVLSLCCCSTLLGVQ